MAAILSRSQCVKNVAASAVRVAAVWVITRPSKFASDESHRKTFSRELVGTVTQESRIPFSDTKKQTNSAFDQNRLFNIWYIIICCFNQSVGHAQSVGSKGGLYFNSSIYHMHEVMHV